MHANFLHNMEFCTSLITLTHKLCPRGQKGENYYYGKVLLAKVNKKMAASHEPFWSVDYEKKMKHWLPCKRTYAKYRKFSNIFQKNSLKFAIEKIAGFEVFLHILKNCSFFKELSRAVCLLEKREFMSKN